MPIVVRALGVSKIRDVMAVLPSKAWSAIAVMSLPIVSAPEHVSAPVIVVPDTE